MQFLGSRTVILYGLLQDVITIIDLRKKSQLVEFPCSQPPPLSRWLPLYLSISRR